MPETLAAAAAAAAATSRDVSKEKTPFCSKSLESYFFLFSTKKEEIQPGRGLVHFVDVFAEWHQQRRRRSRRQRRRWWRRQRQSRSVKQVHFLDENFQEQFSRDAFREIDDFGSVWKLPPVIRPPPICLHIPAPPELPSKLGDEALAEAVSARFRTGRLTTENIFVGRIGAS